MDTIEQRTVLPEVVHVPSADDMSLDIFCQHMTLRHGDSLGGMSRLDPERLTPYVEELYRTFHDKVHDGTLIPGRQFDHSHKAARGAAA